MKMVRIKKNLPDKFGELHVLPIMKEYEGKIVKMEKAKGIKGTNRYCIVGDENFIISFYYWCEELFEPVVEIKF